MLTLALIGYIKGFQDISNIEIKAEEFRNIAKALGYEVCDVISQYATRINSAFLFGRGKVEEIKKKILQSNCDTFLVYNSLSTIQKINLENHLKVKVLDYNDLILEIFDKNAGDRISKLQIELAALQRLIPYIKKKISKSVFRDRPGPRSLGEYAYHNVLRQLISRRKKIREEIDYYKLIKEKEISRRKENGNKVVALCGFYNAGKTSLFNSLTKLNKPVSDVPFTTLSSKYSMVSRGKFGFTVVDTIGFAFDLDPFIIDSFELTLMDMKYSDLALLVIDASDKLNIIEEKLKTSLEILGKLGIKKERILPVLNKVDLIYKSDLVERQKLLENYFNNLEIPYVSSTEKYNLDLLLETIVNKLFFSYAIP